MTSSPSSQKSSEASRRAAPRSDEFEYDCTVRGIVERIAFQLGDAEIGDEFETFDEKWITARVKDTFAWLQGRRPDLFADEQEFELSTAGERHQVPPSAYCLLEVRELVRDGQCFPVHMSDTSTLRRHRLMNKGFSCDLSAFCLYHAAVDDKEARAFTIDPPLTTRGVRVRASVSDMLAYFDDPDRVLECDASMWVNTVIEYVLYQAFSMDSESVVSAALSDRHRVTFFDLAPVQRRQEAPS